MFHLCSAPAERGPIKPRWKILARATSIYSIAFIVQRKARLITPVSMHKPLGVQNCNLHVISLWLSTICAWTDVSWPPVRGNCTGREWRDNEGTRLKKRNSEEEDVRWERRGCISRLTNEQRFCLIELYYNTKSALPNTAAKEVMFCVWICQQHREPALWWKLVEKCRATQGWTHYFLEQVRIRSIT